MFRLQSTQMLHPNNSSRKVATENCGEHLAKGQTVEEPDEQSDAGEVDRTTEKATRSRQVSMIPSKTRNDVDCCRDAMWLCCVADSPNETNSLSTLSSAHLLKNKASLRTSAVHLDGSARTDRVLRGP